MDGNSWTTLCPSPITENAVFPMMSPGQRKGWGCIIFDTYMNDTISATEALTNINGNPTSNYCWAGRNEGKFILGFDFDNTMPALTTMQAVAEKCRNKDSDGGRALDGNRTIPNKDNYEWSY